MHNHLKHSWERITKCDGAQVNRVDKVAEQRPL